MISRFIVHRHSAGRPHFDLRLIQADVLRSWSLMREPPSRVGEKRLAIERETFSAKDANAKVFREEAFGEGRVYTWDEGEVDIFNASARQLDLVFKGTKLAGRYELRRMRWYPGNRWLLKRSLRD
jgi:bifunctional non-homologous end joining protein LigD